MTGHMSRVLNVLLALSVVAVVVQITAAIGMTSPGAQLFSTRPLPLTNRLTAHVIEHGESHGIPVSDVDDGLCRYIVVASSTCSFSRELQLRWTVTALNDPNPRMMPDGWATFWIAVDGPEGAAGFFDDDFPVRHFASDDPFEIVTEAGIKGYPFHLVLDREGRLLSGGLGGELLPRSSFQEDCSIKESLR